ncbi:hypothetical protein BJ508DRAFT_410290 [Ascobolus immersus RN42]|uniref:Uncharacterized protein n=1 Tax=Ascobolus immersus RN42 TaxID=1160509 RepID=A0A3N4J0T3_ASCIM|nr:hypothetical protein BJ508DRAFT_410290 [Ascobolus immersus RN42]
MATMEKRRIIPLTQRSTDIVVLGASGFTGKLISKHLTLDAPQYLKWSISGRSTEKLNSLLATLELLPTTTTRNLPKIQSFEEIDLDTIVGDTRVVISTIGPYALFGEKFLKSCVENGTAWLDLAGEIPWYGDMLQKYETLARETGAVIIPTAGFDSIPSDLSALTIRLLAHSHNTHLTRVSNILESLAGAISNGSYTSIMSIFDVYPQTVLNFLKNPYVLAKPTLSDQEAEQLHPQRTGVDVRKIKDKGMVFANKKRVRDAKQIDAKGGALASMGMIEGINRAVVMRTHALSAATYSTLDPLTQLPPPEFDYREFFLLPPSRIPGKARATAYCTSFLMNKVIPSMMSNTPLRRGMKKMVDKFVPPGTGPSEKLQAEGYWRYRCVGDTEDGRQAWACMQGWKDVGYGWTSICIAETAIYLAGMLKGGDLGSEVKDWEDLSLLKSIGSNVGDLLFGEQEGGVVEGQEENRGGFWTPASLGVGFLRYMVGRKVIDVDVGWAK